ncbi:hypothetical protein [Microbacterium oxydans]|uniref:hypothetical protein n=1 Tax=Microbacterium oxydans TaxID=82380 RepID=UPI0024AE7215|nr:hypothetical protein [Microbacterium oxydans]
MAGSNRFEIDGVLNASGIAKGAKDGEKALADLEEAVGDVADESGKAGGQVDSFASKLVDAARKAGKSDDDIKDSLRTMGLSAKQAERAVDGLEGSLQSAQKEAKQLGDDADDVGDKARRGMERAEEGVKDFKQEAQQSARETAASFDGSFESIADLAQEVAANAFAGFGPAGAAAGIAVAAGLGVAVDQFNKIDEVAKDALQSAYDFAYGIGAAFDAADKVSAVASWTSDQEKFKQVLDLTAASGWDQVEVIDALVEGGDKLDTLTQAYADGANAAGLTVGRMQELDAVLPSIKTGLEQGSEAARAQAEYLYKLSQEAGQATGEVDALGNIIVKLPGDVEVAINAETKTATTDIQRIEDKVNNLPDGQSTVRVNADTSEVDRAFRRINSTTLRVGTKIITADGWNR